jgi:hypothetical protein
VNTNQRYAITETFWFEPADVNATTTDPTGFTFQAGNANATSAPVDVPITVENNPPVSVDEAPPPAG